jgi:SAM-dependent methyltransferase
MPEPTSTLALAVWPPHAGSERRHTYLAASGGKHRIPPELAARAILAYSDPGDLVVDPHCGIGTVLVEAIQNGRRAIGIDDDRSRAAHATANISHAREQGALGRGAVIEGDSAQLPRVLPKAAAILNPPASTTQPGRVRRHPAGSTQLILTAAPARTTVALLSSWMGVLAPGGFLLLVHTQAPGKRRRGLGATVAAAKQAGLQYWQHVIALHTATAELLHTDVLAFRKPHPDRAAARRDEPVRKSVAA